MNSFGCEKAHKQGCKGHNIHAELPSLMAKQKPELDHVRACEQGLDVAPEEARKTRTDNLTTNSADPYPGLTSP